MGSGVEWSKSDYVKTVLDEVGRRLGRNPEPGPGGVHKLGFYLRGPGWPWAYNGFYVLADDHPCLVVHRRVRLSLQEGKYEVRPNNGPNEDKADYVDLVFVDQYVSRGAPPVVFLDRLIAILKSARTE